MTTEKKITANRRNAQLSTGPRTQEGKDAVRQNALKHGLLSASSLLGVVDNLRTFEWPKASDLEELVVGSRV